MGGGDRDREGLTAISSPSQRKFPESRARMGSSGILPSAGKAEAAARLRKWKFQDALIVNGTWGWGGVLCQVRDLQSLSPQNFLRVPVDSTMAANILMGFSCFPEGFLKSLSYLPSHQSPTLGPWQGEPPWNSSL